MSARAVGALLIACSVLGVWIYLALMPTDDSAAFAKIIGCYASAETVPSKLMVEQEGSLAFGTDRVRVSGYRDKTGIALSPLHAVIIDRQDHNRLELDSIHPSLLRFRADDQTLEIPDRHGGVSALFHRVRCD